MSILLNDKQNWVIKQISYELYDLFKNDEDKLYIKNNEYFLFKKKVHYLDTYRFINKFFYKNNYSISYFHGYPNSSYNKNLIIKFKKLINIKHKFNKIHVSHDKMMNYFLENGVNKEKLIKIPICIDHKYLKKNSNDKLIIREKYNLPKNKFIIGSFQKDGVGWGRGDIPKLEKGPDIFVNTMKILKHYIKNIFILISGPSRGYISNQLKKIDVGFKHINVTDYKDIFELYRSLDLYLVASREEGGPRAILESLSQRIPVISTPVGQANDILKKSFFLSSSFESEELSEKVKYYYNKDENFKNDLLDYGYDLANKNTYQSHKNKWKELLFG
jgi:glycosyltransferase involved in cell wall biosynthesis